MNVIIAGGRDFANYPLVVDHCQVILARYCGESGTGSITIFTGGAKGADALGKRYAAEYDWPHKEFLANWKLHGKGAGPIRNSKMAEAADVLIAFWDGESPGTKNMLRTAQKEGLKVHRIMYTT